MIKRKIYCPGPDKWLSIGNYCAVVKQLKAMPKDQIVKETFNGWFPGTVEGTLREFRQGIHDRINANLSYSQRSL